nr:aminoacyl--tRNA ligase-related protein [uncultured Pedobacter sp.]
MKQSQLFQKTEKNVNKADISINAQLLTKAGYVSQLMAGVYSYLPLGLKVLLKIENIIREEMMKVGGQEVLLPALQPREIWDKTGRWDTVDVLFKLKGARDRDLALGPTHEEVVTPLASTIINSYKELPLAVFQIQSKFRNEQRAKSGLLRGREFRMKDMYSFHTDEDEMSTFYNKVAEAYMNVYNRCGIGQITLFTYAIGGTFAKYSHEFQTITESGEDIVYRIPGTNTAINKELMDDIEALNEIIPNYQVGDESKLEQLKAIEVGNIFRLGTKFSDAFDLKYTDKDGKLNGVVMGCYGLGPSRVMGTIAECLSDDKGLVWPEEIAPFKIHLISLAFDDQEVKICNDIYDLLLQNNIEVLYDDRKEIRSGTKLADADLLGIPNRLVVSKRTLADHSVEWKKRTGNETVSLPISAIVSQFASSK